LFKTNIMTGSSNIFDLSAELADIPGGQVVDPSLGMVPASGDDPGTPPADTVPPAGDPPAADPVDWFTAAKPVFKELLEEEPESVEALRTRISTERAELKELRNKAKEFDPALVQTINDRLKAIEAENEELLRDINPISHFRSEEAYRREQLAILFKGKDYSEKGIDIVLSNDVTKMSAMDVIKAGLILEYGVDSEEDMTKILERKYNIDATEEDLDKDPYVKSVAKDFRKTLLEIKNTEIPKAKDYKAIKDQRLADMTTKQVQLETAWSPVVDKAVKSLTKLTVPFKGADGKDESFEFAVEESTLLPYVKRVTDILAKGGKELSEENLRGVMSTVHDRVVLDNLQKITAAYTNQKLAELDERWARETNNPRKLNQQQKPPAAQDVKPHSKEAAEAFFLQG